MKHSEPYERLLCEKGHSLELLGFDETALECHGALQAIVFLRASALPILGGDGYWKRGTEIDLAGEGRSCDPVPGETADDYLTRAAAKAESFVR